MLFVPDVLKLQAKQQPWNKIAKPQGPDIEAGDGFGSTRLVEAVYEAQHDFEAGHPPPYRQFAQVGIGVRRGLDPFNHLHGFPHALER